MRVFLSASLVLCLSPVFATDVQVEFEGIVVGGLGMITPGSTITGSIRYDTLTPETPGSPSGAWFDAISSLEVTYDNGAGGVFTYTSPSGRILIENDSGGTDNLGFSTIPTGVLSGPTMAGLDPGDFTLIVNGASTSFFPSLSLADAPTTYSLADFTGNLTLESFFIPGLPGVPGGFVVGSLTALEAAPVDSDGDGIPDDEDACPNSDLGPTVVVGGCDSGVANTLLPDGCTISDLLAACDTGSRIESVRCVLRLLLRLKIEGVIGLRDAIAILKCIARGRGADLISTFIRADTNNDGIVDISDCVETLGFLFLGGDSLACRDAADANDDGAIDVSDVSYALSFLFSGGAEPAAPFPGRGFDLTEDDLWCAFPSIDTSDSSGSTFP